MERDEAPQFTDEDRAVVFSVIILLLIFAVFPPIEILIIGGLIIYVITRVSPSQEEEQVDSQDEIIIDASPPIQGEIDTVEVPTECPSCGKEIGLNTIKWIDSRTGLCPHCESIITAT